VKNFQKHFYNLPPFLLSSIASVLTIVQIILSFFLRGSSSAARENAGWICLWISGLFGTLPILTFRRKGGVVKGESYIKTTRLVDTGIYALVRHPQIGTAWLLINFGLILIAWHWTGTLLGLISMSIAYADTFKADKKLIGKFGGGYEEYIQKVPRVNFITGFLRLLFRTSSKN